MVINNPKLLDWENHWLSWAYRVVRMNVDKREHFCWCRDRLTKFNAEYSESDPAGDPTLRWPGYIGKFWKPGCGVLFVGSVHADFTAGGDGSIDRSEYVRRLAEANRFWRDNTDPVRTAEAYLRETQRIYAALAPGWARGTVLADVLESLMRELDPATRFQHAAWTNLAHCRAKPGAESTASPEANPKKMSEYPLQLKCSSKNGVFPIGELVTAIWPAAILVSVKLVDPEFGSYRRQYEWVIDPSTLPRPLGVQDPLIRAFDGSTRTEAGFWQGSPRAVWVPNAVKEIRSRCNAVQQVE